MSKKTALIFLIAFVAWIASAFIGVEFFGILSVLYFIGLIVLFFRLVVKSFKKNVVKHKQGNKTAPVVQQKKTVKHSPAVPQTYDEKPLSYEYSDVGVYVPDLSAMEGIKVGDLVSLESEPENEFDPGAVAIYVFTPGKNEGLTKIGYMYRGRLQNMANDWLKNDRHNFCIISYIDLSVPDAKRNGVKIDISFYN